MARRVGTSNRRSSSRAWLPAAIGVAGSLFLIGRPCFAQQKAGGAAPALPCPEPVRFAADPIGDGAMLAASFGFAGVSELIMSTGEIRPQQIDAAFDTRKLLGIDRNAIFQKLDPSAAAFSNAGIYTALGFAVLDPILSGFRDGRDAGLVDAVMYAEAISFSWALTNIAKIGFRRPRPIVYIDRLNAIEKGEDPATLSNTSTDSSLSFFSGHAALTSTIAATATYLAFARAPGTHRPWMTLTAGIALTSFVSVERVRSGAHFPTDVIAGSLAGAGVGLLVVHLHREDRGKRPVWVGAAPTLGGGAITLSGAF